MAILKDKPATTAEAVAAMHLTICKVVHKYMKNHYGDFDDLYQRGAEGVLRAYSNYDDSKGASFSTHAYPWIWALVKDTAKDNWNRYNSTSSVDVNIAMDANEAYEQDVDSMIDLSRKLERMDELTRGIVVARHEGYNFREIAEGLTKLGTPCTLHQVRNKYIDAMGAE